MAYDANGNDSVDSPNMLRYYKNDSPILGYIRGQGKTSTLES